MMNTMTEDQLVYNIGRCFLVEWTVGGQQRSENGAAVDWIHWSMCHEHF